MEVSGAAGVAVGGTCDPAAIVGVLEEGVSRRM